MIENKHIKLFCEMHKKEVETDTIWQYNVKGTNEKAYTETAKFCSYECLIAYLIDDEKVLKLKLRRMNVDRAIRHPHSLARAPTKKSEFEYVLEADPYTKKETVEVLEFDDMNGKALKKEFDKDELASLYAAYGDDE